MTQYREHIEEFIETTYAIEDISYESELREVTDELKGFINDSEYAIKDNLIDYVESEDESFSYDALSQEEKDKFMELAKEIVESHIKYLNEECEVSDDVINDYYDDYEGDNW